MTQEQILTQKIFAAFTNQSAAVFNLQTQLDLKDLELKAKDKEIAELQQTLTELIEGEKKVLEVPE